MLWQLVFSRFRGRLARKPYWIGIAAVIGLRALADALAASGGGPAILVEATDLLLAGVAALVGARLRDFGRSAIWGWIGMALIEAATIAVMVGTWPRYGDVIDFSEIPRPAILLNGVLLAVLIGLVGLIRGDAGANRDGPAPAGADPGPAPARGRLPEAGDDEEDRADVDALIARSLAARAAAAAPAASPAAALGAPPPRPGAPVFGKRR
ncbi:MAG: DUF805 domain-containing protein [Roseiarcus sp.]